MHVYTYKSVSIYIEIYTHTHLDQIWGHEI